MKRGFADTPDGQIHYRTEGVGEAILLLHASPNSSVEFNKVVPILARKYRAIAVDRIGYGDSDKPPHQYEMSDYARVVVDFLDALGISKASLVGWHTGAGEAGEVAASYPERVDKLVLTSYPLYTQEMIEERRKGLVPHISRIMPLQLKEDGSHLNTAWDWVSELRGPNASLEDIHEHTIAILEGGPRNAEAPLALWRYVERGDAQKRLTLIKCPTLVLMFPRSKFYFQREVIKKLIPRSKIVVIGKDVTTPHVPSLAAEEFAQAIMDFVANPGL